MPKINKTFDQDIKDNVAPKIGAVAERILDGLSEEIYTRATNLTDHMKTIDGNAWLNWQREVEIATSKIEPLLVAEIIAKLRKSFKIK